MARIKVLSSICSAILLCLCACSSNDKYTIEGRIHGEEGQIAYLDEIGFSKTVCIDSVQVGADGRFSFSGDNKAHTPRFFRLRHAQKTAIIPIDSTETITVTEDNGAFSFVNSPNAETLQALPAYDKEKVKRVIFQNPASATAVYALLLQNGGKPMFDIENKTDLQFYTMVATAYDKQHPESEYTKWLRKVVYERKNALLTQQNLQKALQNSTEKGAFEISLPDTNGNTIRLSDLKGKTVLLTFSYFLSDFYDEEELMLKKISEHFADNNFEIYAISFDTDYESWHAKAATLPWISVHDKRALRSILLSTYNISTLPAYFIVNADGDIISRHEKLNDNTVEAIEKTIK